METGNIWSFINNNRQIHRINFKLYRIDFNLTKGKKPEDDIGLHLSCRFDENAIVRNSYDGGWGREERGDNGRDLPIGRGMLRK